MTKLLILGAMLLSSHGHLTHHQQPRYWWPAANTCMFGTIERNGVLRGRPGVFCTTTPAGWHSTPPDINPADIVDPSVWNGG